MKNRKFTYLLIACAIVIWGVIFINIYAATDPNEPVITTSKKVRTAYFNPVNHESDSVLLMFNYRDPFADPVTFSTGITNDQALAQVTKQVQLKPRVDWTKVSYAGFIYNQMKKQPVAIMIIHGKEVMLSVGEEFGGLKLIKYATDSVKVHYQHESKFIKIK